MKISDKTYKLVETTNPRMEKYIDKPVKIELVDENGRQYLSALCLSGNPIGFTTSYIDIFSNKNGVVSIKTENSFYRFEEVKNEESR